MSRIQITEIRKNRNSRVLPTDLIFLVSWSVFLLSVLFKETIWYKSVFHGTFPTICQYARYGTYFLCLFLLVVKSYKKSIWMSILFLILGFGISMLASTNKTIFLYSFVLFAAYEIPMKKIVKTTFILQMVVLLGSIILSQTGLIIDYIFDPENRARHGLGFSWATDAPILFFYCILLYILLRQKKMSLFEFGAIELINLVLYRATDARMSFYLLTIALTFFLLLKFWNFRPLLHQKWKWILCLTPFVVCALAILLHAVYNPENDFMNRLNTLLSGRLKLGKRGIEEFGFKLFGQPIEWVGFGIEETTKVYNYVDCAYLQIALEYGVVPLILILFIYAGVIYRSLKNRNYYLFFCILFVLGLAVTEPRLMNFAYNPFPVLLLSEMDDVPRVENLFERFRRRQEMKADL